MLHNVSYCRFVVCQNHAVFEVSPGFVNVQSRKEDFLNEEDSDLHFIHDVIWLIALSEAQDARGETDADSSHYLSWPAPSGGISSCP
jgi:hypothetical protein